jgi:hypothetical protein
MSLRHQTVCGLLACVAAVAAASAASGQPTAETFNATATIKTAGGATATAPVVITVTRKMTQKEADTFTGAFASGGVAGLRKALSGVPPTGTIQVGAGKPTPTRLTLERPTDKGRLLTIVTDQPIALLGAGLPQAKPKEGYDFGIVDITVDAQGGGSGTMSPAAKVTVKQGAFVVDEYSGELVQLGALKKVK